MSNNADVSRFLMLTLGVTAAFMHFFGVALLKWQTGHSFLYAYTMALSDTSLPGAEGLNTVFYTVTCLTMGAFGAWVFDVFMSTFSRLNDLHKTSDVKRGIARTRGED